MISILCLIADVTFFEASQQSCHILSSSFVLLFHHEGVGDTVSNCSGSLTTLSLSAPRWLPGPKTQYSFSRLSLLDPLNCVGGVRTSTFFFPFSSLKKIHFTYTQTQTAGHSLSTTFINTGIITVRFVTLAVTKVNKKRVNFTKKEEREKKTLSSATEINSQ